LDARQRRYVRAAFEKELAKFPAGQRDALRAAFDTPAGRRTEGQGKLVAAHPKLNITPGVLYQYDQRAADELNGLRNQVALRRARKPAEGFVAVLSEVPGRLPPTRVFHRGDYRQPGAEVRPGDLTVTAPEGRRLEIAPGNPKLPTSGRRLAYARHLTSGRHPLIGRVLANRIWLHHFGRGLVDTPGDFGALGRRPTHPELLDYLADELARGGWGLKRMHRLLMTSTAYRQSSRRGPAGDAADAHDALLRRLPAAPPGGRGPARPHPGHGRSAGPHGVRPAGAGGRGRRRPGGRGRRAAAPGRLPPGPPQPAGGLPGGLRRADR
jgi:hypothetical protein